MLGQLRIICGDSGDAVQELPAESIHCVVTSPPYWGLRDYGVSGQIGLEKTPEEYVAKMVEVFREVRRVLRSDGTLWLNLGDSYVANCSNQNPQTKQHLGSGLSGPNRNGKTGLKPKDLCGIPWRVAFALQAEGWWLRSEIIWHKPNPMPESVTDRPTKSHEQIFLLANSERYYYDADAILEPCSESTHARLSQDVQNQIGSARSNGGAKTNGNMKAVARKSWHGSEFHDGRNAELHPNVGKNRIKDNLNMDSALAIMPEMRNKRSVWTVPTKGFKGAHFATFPPDLVKPCILAGCPAGGTVLDPFGGSGTTGQVALELGRNAILIELNPEYIKLAEQRCRNATPGFAF